MGLFGFRTMLMRQTERWLTCTVDVPKNATILGWRFLFLLRENIPERLLISTMLLFMALTGTLSLTLVIQGC
jgi:hypothetical protein